MFFPHFIGDGDFMALIGECQKSEPLQHCQQNYQRYKYRRYSQNDENNKHPYLAHRNRRGLPFNARPFENGSERVLGEAFKRAASKVWAFKREKSRTRRSG
jgi:hypothetical protein